MERRTLEKLIPTRICTWTRTSWNAAFAVGCHPGLIFSRNQCHVARSPSEVGHSSFERSVPRVRQRAGRLGSGPPDKASDPEPLYRDRHLQEIVGDQHLPSPAGRDICVLPDEVGYGPVAANTISEGPPIPDSCQRPLLPHSFQPHKPHRGVRAGGIKENRGEYPMLFNARMSF